MTGGRIYTHSLAKVFPNYQEAPLQRKVTHERISLMSPDSNFTIDYAARELEEAGKESYTVLRGPFDQWLAEQAENAGAEFIYGIGVEDPIIEDGKVKGILAFGDEITSDVVILADGVNSLLTSKAGPRRLLLFIRLPLALRKPLSFLPTLLKAASFAILARALPGSSLVTAPMVSSVVHLFMLIRNPFLLAL